MAHDTTETVRMRMAPGRARRSGAKPPTDRNLGLTPNWQVRGLVAVAAAALVLQVWSLTRSDRQGIGDAGLISALPPTYYIALTLSLAGFVASLSLRRFIPKLLTWQVVVLVLVLHSADLAIHGLPRPGAGFRNPGIVDHFHRSGQPDTGLDALFNWPGFSNLLGMLSGATGVSDLTVIAAWAPAGINVILLAPLLALATRLTSTPRQAWAGVWVFYLTSWVGQDYLAPQAYAFVLLLTLLALLLSVFSGWAWPTDRSRFGKRLARTVSRLDGSSARQGIFQPSKKDAAILVVVCALILLVMGASHQLTPFAVVPFLALFLLTGRLRLRFLPILAVVLPVGWLVFAASAYFQGHLGQLFGSFGDIGANTVGAVPTRMSDSEAHVFVLYTLVTEVVLVWVLAAIGAITGFRRNAPWLTAAAGALAPLFLIPAQPYDSELLLRLYLFSLPFAACLVVLPVMSERSISPDRTTGLGLQRALILLLLGGLLAAATIVTRYGNDSYRALVPAQSKPAPLNCGQANETARNTGAYVIVTRSQHTAADLRGSTFPGGIQRFVDTCGTSTGWTKVSENAGGVIFQVKGANNGK